MYEDMTFENIMVSMMEDMPDGLDTSEGSLIYHSCVKQAARLEEVYVELAALTDNQYADTADLDHLVQFGQERRTYIEEAMRQNLKEYLMFRCRLELNFQEMTITIL